MQNEICYWQKETYYLQKEICYWQKETYYLQNEIYYWQKETCYWQKESCYWQKESCLRQKESCLRQKESCLRQKETSTRLKKLISFCLVYQRVFHCIKHKANRIFNTKPFHQSVFNSFNRSGAYLHLTCNFCSSKFHANQCKYFFFPFT